MAEGKKTKKRKVSKKKKPNFNVPNESKVRIKSRWRKPRGIDNKKRIRKKQFGANVKVGYKNKEEVRGLHPLGLQEIMVCNLKELEGVKEMENVGVRISGKVSKRNKELIRAKAKEMRVRVFN